MDAGKEREQDAEASGRDFGNLRASRPEGRSYRKAGMGVDFCFTPHPVVPSVAEGPCAVKKRQRVGHQIPRLRSG